IEDLRYQKSMYNSSYGGGFMEGREKGLVEGMERGKALVIEQLLTHRFGPLPDAIIARIRQAGMAELDDWTLKCLTVASLAELFDV
ncbi:DUF4351 domain-containing protein, partial [Candidatus Woesearchaeota archaeon]|nr:DUF4351 domain-containing protein [Candidatus Woesearchaeota archaeon]